MSDTVLLVAIIAITVVVILILFRSRLSSFWLRADTKGLETHLNTRSNQDVPYQVGERPVSGGVKISGNKIIGQHQSVDVTRGDVDVHGNIIKGSDQSLNIGLDGTEPKK